MNDSLEKPPARIVDLAAERLARKNIDQATHDFFLICDSLDTLLSEQNPDLGLVRRDVGRIIEAAEYIEKVSQKDLPAHLDARLQGIEMKIHQRFPNGIR